MNSPLLLFNALQLNVDLDEIGVIERSDFFSPLWEDVSPLVYAENDSPGLLC